FRILGKVGDSSVFSMEKLNLSLENIYVDKETIKNKIPFSYRHYELGTGMVFADLGPYEALSLSGTSIKNRELQLVDLSLKSKYDKTTLFKKLDKEHDYIDLKIPEIRM